MKPPVYAMMPPRVDAPVGKMKPVQQPKVAKMRGIDEALDYYLGPTGIPDKLRAVNSMFNPVETLGGSMKASQRMLAPDTAPMDRVRYMGDMLSGVAGFVGCHDGALGSNSADLHTKTARPIGAGRRRVLAEVLR